jgi:ribosomal protein S18 acetylase RimI-like enzyme
MTSSSPSEILLQPARAPESVALARTLFLEYQASLDVDLCFQGFRDELDGLPGFYAEPSGRLLLAMVDGTLAGCGCFRPFLHSDHINACEMKRLYVRPKFRGLGVGRLLVESLMGDARLAGYSTMLLDTLSDMETARSLYRQARFVEVAPYYLNPIPGAHYLKAAL